MPRDGITPTSYIRSGACCFSKGIMYERGEEGGRASARSIASRCIFRLQYLPPSDDSLVPRKNRAQLESRSFRGVPGNCRAIKVLVGARVTRLPCICACSSPFYTTPPLYLINARYVLMSEAARRTTDGRTDELFTANYPLSSLHSERALASVNCGHIDHASNARRQTATAH